ncbi:hypothetical protein MLP_11420 [Microlunatus phosphovorus NM-1]|uniref:GGDEF domain-containing protein n=1 Tax=Microlunatus phosphovorus (strain ATCC 700054 / DSM 10555 / JCM 9379 / NBRC 101784 / NCIMB 13414 / VKM Ac-1990 / NM-1) TaxID=1032480 RepID=F5XNP2_MICPN|nr:hypothetical protein [Microlunatus phosphovorus]BAK34156.1 hypothetical protein MLP_11420 [Microlunatus phosphovorus NM-1]
MPAYIDVGVVRIQEYITRTSGAAEGQLRKRRGASRMVANAAAASYLDLGLEPNPESYHVEGVAHLRSIGTLSGAEAADRAGAAIERMRAQLPYAYLRASWALADTYSTAFTLLDAARRGETAEGVSGVLDYLPPPRDTPFSKRCKSCGLGEVITGDTCGDCRRRDQAGKAQTTSDAPTPEERVLAEVNHRAHLSLTAVTDLTGLARLPVDPHAKRNHLATIYADGNGVGKLFESIGDRTAAQTTSKDLDSAIRGAGRDALVSLLPYCRDKSLPAVVTVLAADDALITVPAQLGWTFTETLLTGFAQQVSGYESLSLTAGIVFSHVKSPIEAAISAADEAMRDAKRARHGQAAIGWADLTHPGGEDAKICDLAWLRDRRQVLDLVSGLPASQRSGWERIIAEAAAAEVDAADLMVFFRREFNRLGSVLADLDLTLDEFQDMLDLARWWAPPRRRDQLAVDGDQ